MKKRESVDVTIRAEQAQVLRDLSQQKDAASQKLDAACSALVAGAVEGAGEASIEAIGPDFIRLSVERVEEDDAPSA